MIATAVLRRWLRGGLVLALFLAATGLALGLAAGPAWASGGGGGGGAGGMAQAKKDLLVKSDLPAGWSSQGSVTTSGSGSVPPAVFNALVSCLGASPALVRAGLNAPSVNSPTFSTQGGVYGVQDSVTPFSSVKMANQQYQLAAEPKVPACMNVVVQQPSVKQLFAGSGGSGAILGTITVSATSGAYLIPHSTGYTMLLPFTVHGIALDGTITIVSLVRGKYGSQLTYTSVGQPFPVALERHLDTVAYGRT
jgi:hypothetical protein